MIAKAVVAALLALALLVGAGYGLYRLDIEQDMAMPAAAPAPAASVATALPAPGKTVLYWHDPMVPGQRFDKPGKSPFMDMQLVPVYAGEEGDEAKVAISGGVQQNLGIRTAEVIREDLAPVVEAVGSVTYNERDVASVQARSNGFVERLLIRTPLEHVVKGQPLAELHVPEWVALQEEYQTAKRLQKASGAELVRAALQRMHLAGMNEEQIRAVKASDVVRTRLPLNAPLTGVVAELKVREGMTVMTGTPMFTIYGLETVWITADVPENLATQLRPGDMVEARTPALPQLVFKGEVSALLPEINQATRTLKARIEIANPRGQLVPGMFATIGFKPSARKGVLTVPVEAVIATGKRSVVMVSLNEGRFTPVDVETGLEANSRIEIRKGLKSGQKVVVSGQFLIDSEASLRGATTRMGEPPAAKGQNATPAQTHRGEGKVESVDNNEVIVSHDPMPTLQWGPMTMVFKPPPGGMPGNVKVGDRVTFEIRQTGNGRYELTRISPAPSTRAPHAHAATAPPASPGRAPRVNPAADRGAPSGEPHHAHH